MMLAFFAYFRQEELVGKIGDQGLFFKKKNEVQLWNFHNCGIASYLQPILSS